MTGVMSDKKKKEKNPNGSRLGATLHTHLQFVLVLFVDAGQQLGFASVQGLDEGVALRHQAGLELHAVLLRDRTDKSL